MTDETNQQIKLELALKRGAINEWHRQEVAVYIADTFIKSRWVPLNWNDGEIAAALLFDVSIPDKDGIAFPISDHDRLVVAKKRLEELNVTPHGLSQAGLAAKINQDTGSGLNVARLVVEANQQRH